VSEQHEPPAHAENHAWRLTFDYDGDQVTLVGQEQVAMLAPPDDSEHAERAETGYHVELRDEAGRPIYRRRLHAPLADSYEVFSPEPGARIRRVPMGQARGRFTAVVPDVAGGRTVVLVGPAPPAGGSQAEGATARPTGRAAADSAPAGRTTLIEVRLGQPPEGRS
jgi:hypothetical protein